MYSTMPISLVSKRSIQSAKEREKPRHASAHHLRQIAKLKDFASSIPKSTLTSQLDSHSVQRQLLQSTTKIKLQSTLPSPTKQSSITPVARPQSTGTFKPRKIERTRFRYFYDRGDLPVRINFAGAVRKLQWQVDLMQLDYSHYLPMFMEGLRELDEPYHFLALTGVMDMLERGQGRPLTCLPLIILPIKQNLMTRHPRILCEQMKVLQKLVLCCPYAGEALVPYYRQLLSIFNLFITKRINCGDAIDYAQRRQEGLGDLILETLHLLERHGGPDAFVNIKYMIPTYESCVHAS
ncbi:hypothetical protein Poli38472_009975 [Pythium oligandrum]|uniref:Parkin co-regulated protein n=1 Tax=Pythium oligandrum TaxID=41045 RepID=A0A8K1C840_PYTOL|nr:hypothetical protein Poli38472_009975 [Pythium oligandrum]|eukprot:TMW58416.1 hypothetical protein Poli38472_009975 [Pythium oligandrum]